MLLSERIHLCAHVVPRYDVLLDNGRCSSPHIVRGVIEQVRDPQALAFRFGVVTEVARDKRILVNTIANLKCVGVPFRDGRSHVRRDTRGRMAGYNGFEIVLPNGVTAVITTWRPVARFVLEIDDRNALFVYRP